MIQLPHHGYSHQNICLRFRCVFGARNPQPDFHAGRNVHRVPQREITVKDALVGYLVCHTRRLIILFPSNSGVASKLRRAPVSELFRPQRLRIVHRPFLTTVGSRADTEIRPY